MKIKRKLITMTIITFLASSVFGSMTLSQEIATSPSQGYESYKSQYTGIKNATDSITLPAKDATLVNGILEKEKYGHANVAVLGEESAIEWSFEALEDSLYSLAIESHSDLKMNTSYRFAVKINDVVPYEEATSIDGSKIWKYEDQENDRFDLDGGGNEITPKQVEADEWSKRFVYESDGVSNEPLKFYIKKGVNKITIQYFSGNIVIDNIRLENEPEPPSYSDALKEWGRLGIKEIKGSDAAPIKIEGELLYSKSKSSIIPTMDRTSSTNSPTDPSKIRLNVIGGRSWEFGGTWIKYMVNIEKTGLYRLDFKVRQDVNRGLSSTRKIYIDDKIQYKELENVNFPYSNEWYVHTLGGNNPMLVYLEKGQRYITIEVSSSKGALYKKLQDFTYRLNDIYRKIIMVTGAVPDVNRDYKINTVVPNLLKDMTEITNELTALRSQMSQMGFDEGGEGIIVEKAIQTFGSLIKKPSTFPARLALFKDTISGLGTLMWIIDSQPLEIDYFKILPTEVKKDKAQGSFWEELSFGFKSYIATYFNDYTQIDNKFDKKVALEVWVGQGREQAQIIKRLINEKFYPKYKIPVNINLVQQAPTGQGVGGQTQSISTGLVSATLTGRGPDISIFTSPNEIINLAARDAITDVSRFADFEEINKRFHPNSANAFKYLGKYYALPITQHFNMMFYRKDIFEQLGIKPPNTWTDLYKIIPIIQRNNLTIGIPSLEQTFQNMLFQNGGSYYIGDWEKCGFDSEEALKAFKQWTELYTKYSLPVEFDLYSRFRTGEMPLEISSFTLYNQLVLAAPEITGLWEMLPIPGTLKADGTIDRTVAGLGTGVVMFNKTKNKEDGWEFMKWWTSTEIQAEFGLEIEKIFGKSSRYDTANIEAFKLLPWETEQKTQLLEQWQNLEVVQLTPVTYYLTRDINNAFRKAVYRRSNVRETLNYYLKDINKEIVRKRKQFDLK